MQSSVGPENQTHESRIERARDVVVAVLCGLASLVVTLSVLAPGLKGGDAGELIVAAKEFTLAHAPGYPLYTFLGHIVVVIGETMGFLPAISLNAFSAMAEAVTTALVAFLVVTHTKNRPAGIVAAAIYATGPLTLTYASSAEVFALHHALVALTLVVSSRALTSMTTRWTALTGVVCGLSLSHHHTAVFTSVPLCLWVLAVANARGDVVAHTRTLVLGLVIGLLPYALLPVLSENGGLAAMGDATSLDGFLHHVLRRDYGTLQLVNDGAAAGSTFSARAIVFLSSTRTNIGAIGVALAVLGVWAVHGPSGPHRPPSFTRGLPFLWALAVGPFLVLANINVDSAMLRGVFVRFFGHAHLFAALLAGVGFARLSQILVDRFHIGIARRAPSWGRVFARAVLSAVVLLPAVMIPVLFSTVDVARTLRAQRGPFIEDHARSILDALPENAALLVRGDLASNAVKHAQVALHRRVDVTVLDQELLSKNFYVARATRETTLTFPGARFHPTDDDGFTLAAFVHANPSRAFYVHPDVKPGDDSLQKAHAFIPEGMNLRIVEKSVVDEWTAEANPMGRVRTLRWPDERVFQDDTWESEVRRARIHAFDRMGVFLLERAIVDGGDVALLERARRVLEESRALRQGPSRQEALRREPVPWSLWKNLGLTYTHLSRHQPSLQSNAREAFERYLDAAPTDERDRNAVLKLLASFDAGGVPAGDE